MRITHIWVCVIDWDIILTDTTLKRINSNWIIGAQYYRQKPKSYNDSVVNIPVTDNSWNSFKFFFDLSNIMTGDENVGKIYNTSN